MGARRLSGARGRALRWLALVAVATLAPLAFLAGLLAGEERLSGVTVEPQPLVVPASAVVVTDRVGAVATLAWETGPPLHAPDWHGIVTRVDLEPGQALRTGDPVLAIDGVTRLAATLAQPFYRPLSREHRGEDVAALHDLLHRLGLLEELPGDQQRFLPATEQAVRQLARDLGIAVDTRTFEPSWVVRLPDEPWTVGAVELQLGLPPPPLGAVIAAGPEVLAGVALTNFDAGPLDLDPSLRWVFEHGGFTAEVDPVEQTLAASSLPDLGSLVAPGTESVTGHVKRREPLEGVAVPATAVGTGADGSTCVWAPSGQGYTAVRVTVQGGLAGVTYLAPNPAAPPEVLSNPAAVLEDATCPSS